MALNFLSTLFTSSVLAAQRRYYGANRPAPPASGKDILTPEETDFLADQLCPTPALRGHVERLFLVDVIAFDWNCPKYITPRYTETEIQAAVAPLHQRIAELEARLRLHSGDSAGGS